MIAFAPPPARAAFAACEASTLELLEQILALSRAALSAVEADDVDGLLEALAARQRALEAADPCLRALLDAPQRSTDAALARVRDLATEAGVADALLRRAAAAARERMAREIEELDAAATAVLAYHRVPVRAAALDCSG